MAYYWVNKSERYQTKDRSWVSAPKGMLGNYIWAPLKNKKGGPIQHHWKILNDIKPGDCLFVSVNSAITAIAIAKEAAVVVPAPIDFISWNGDGYKVVVEYQPLEQKIPVSSFYERIKEDLPKRYGPLNVNGEANQGYCFLVGDTAGEYIKNLISSREENIEIVGFSDLSQEPMQEDDTFYIPSNEKDARKKIMRTISQRQGQPKFRNGLLENYEGRCAVSSSNAQAVLEAAHIIPYNGEETNHLSNGLLLRADIHTLFDKGLLKISSEDYSVNIDPSLRGTEYERYKGLRIRMPIKDFPSKNSLKRKHQDSD